MFTSVLGTSTAKQQRLLCWRCALQSSSPKFHRPKCRNGEDIAGHMCGADASVGRGRERRLEKITRLFQAGGVCSTGIELFDRLDRCKPLLSRVVHGIQILVGEQGEQDRHDQRGDRGGLFAQR